MANIGNINDAINRVRTILDRGNSPWMSNSEIRDFISMATNEFVREKVNIFGATQEIRDDLGDYVRTKEVDFDDANNSSHWSNIGINVSNFENNIEVTFGYLLGIKIEQFNAVYDEEGVFAEEYTSSYYNCKVISLDDAQSVLDDPFNKPEQGSYRAVKISHVYYILPNLEQEFDEDNNLIVDYSFHFDYVADNHDNENTNIVRLPQHSREEVCQIAARKILGTIADERYPVGDAEINQLKK